MTELTALEEAALQAILSEAEATGSRFAKAILGAKVTGRRNAGHGFFTNMLVREAPDEAWSSSPLGEEVWIIVEGMEYGLGVLLFVKDWPTLLLEGYAIAPEDTFSIDLGNVQFRVNDKPEAFRPQ